MKVVELLERRRPNWQELERLCEQAQAGSRTAMPPADVSRLGALYRGTILPQAHTTVSAALAAYRVGSVDFMTLLDDQMTVNQYRQDLFALEAQRGEALAELEMLLSRPLFNPDDALLASGGPQ